MSKKIRTGDRVMVISGNDKGKSGTVVAKSETKVLVRGVNMRIKHVKKTQQMQGGRVEREMPIHISNVALATKEGLKVRARIRQSENKKQGNGRELVYRSGGQEIVYRPMKKPA
jgi:large subunit ribosomal protein L24